MEQSTSTPVSLMLNLRSLLFHKLSGSSQFFRRSSGKIGDPTVVTHRVGTQCSVVDTPCVVPLVIESGTVKDGSGTGGWTASKKP